MNLEDINYFKSYYEKHPCKFVEDYLSIKLPWYQKVFIRLLNNKINKLKEV